MTEHEETTVIIDELREALARYDAWPTRETAAVVIVFAQRLIRAIDGAVDAYKSENHLFENLSSRSQKLRCTVCGATGYDVNGPLSWKNNHVRGHAPCPKCGKQLTVLQNGKPRTHARCPAKEL